jgi:hypothetical protein
MKALRSFETSVIIYQSTRRTIPLDLSLQQHCCENLKCRFNFFNSCVWITGSCSHLIFRKYFWIVMLKLDRTVDSVCCTEGLVWRRYSRRLEMVRDYYCWHSILLRAVLQGLHWLMQFVILGFTEVRTNFCNDRFWKGSADSMPFQALLPSGICNRCLLWGLELSNSCAMRSVQHKLLIGFVLLRVILLSAGTCCW